MTFPLPARLALSALAIFAVASCSSGSYSTLPLKNPDFFSGRVSDGTMTGSFNASGYSANQVRSLISNLCDTGAVTGFATQASEDGLTLFSASCETWKYGTKYVEFEPTAASNTYLAEITGKISGSLALIQKEITL